VLASAPTWLEPILTIRPFCTSERGNKMIYETKRLPNETINEAKRLTL
jgi:hypothetical protein